MISIVVFCTCIPMFLYEYVRDYAKSIGCHNITLNVWEGNNPAISFYKNMGMQVQKTTMEIIL